MPVTSTHPFDLPAYDDIQHLPTYGESLQDDDDFTYSKPSSTKARRLARFGTLSLNGPADEYTNSPSFLHRIRTELGQSLVAPPPTWGLPCAGDQCQFRLKHGHDYRLRALLWEPSHVQLGDVGFIDQRTGTFVKLLNAFESSHTAHDGAQSIPDMFGPSALHSLEGVERTQDSSKNVSSSWSAWRKSYKVCRGAKEAVVISEGDCFRYLNNTDRPQKWFHRFIDHILSAYGPTHGLRRKDIIFVLGCLEASRWAVCVGDKPQTVRVKVASASQRRSGQEWATLVDDKSSLPLPSTSYHISASATTPERQKAILLYGMHFVADKVLTSI
ncbi:hypothetical protein EXIGLDRAFT_845304 [Exidia glandulosa HHB12029]|uniref:Uncharacterized protein n=1 Tax=Exidia glandulosa HHB12029 TaxID=1314781 RepID=A0A165BJ01_EXIGL|nr:hypothetical protein EXIGLDRAFT_845304 [Exidia glandulosa HHB12029]